MKSMYLISNRYVSSAELQRVTAGSFEEQTRKLESAIVAESARIFGAKTEAKVIGTYPTHAVILAEDGRCVRLRYEIKDGVTKILGHESMKVESVTPEQKYDLLKTEATQAARSFAKGDLTEAKARIKDIVKLVDSRSIHRDAQLVDAMVAFRRDDRPWKEAFREKADTIRRLVLDEVSEINKDRIQPKFSSLNDGGVKLSEVDKYRELVIESLKKLDEHCGCLYKQVTDAVIAARAKGINDPAVRAYLAFGDDLGDDLRSTQKTASEALKRITRTECLGKLHDALAADFGDRETASRYVVKMSKRLVGAA
jgi:hypothetical protein